VPNIDEMRTEVLKSFPDPAEFPYRSQTSFHLVLMVSCRLFVLTQIMFVAGDRFQIWTSRLQIYAIRSAEHRAPS
jgi:hypothetical protein